MRTTYRTLFELSLEHDYFNQEVVNPFMRFGSRVLNDAGRLKVKEMNNKVIVYGDSNDDFSNLPSACFSIDFIDADFFSYTNLSFELSNKLIYFSNAVSSSNKISSSDALALPNQPKRFVYVLESEKSETTEQTQARSLAMKRRLLRLPHISLANGFNLDLEDKTSGAYQIDLDFLYPGSSRSYPFFISNDFYQNPPQAVFEWQNNIPQNAVVKYTLRFKSRATHWRYYMIGLSEKEWETTTIRSAKIEGQTVNFIKKSKPQTLPDGRAAFVFYSDQSIPFRQRPDWKIMLTSKQFPEGIPLPYASPGALQVLNPVERVQVQDHIARRLQSEDLPDQPITAYCSDIFFVF